MPRKSRAARLEPVSVPADETLDRADLARLITEERRKRAAAEALREVVLALSSLNLSVILQRILEHATELVGANAVAAFELEPDVSGQGEFVARTALGLETEFFAALRFPQFTGALGRAVASRQPVLARVLGSEDQPSGLETAFPYRSMIALPLAARGSLFGGLALYFEAEQDFKDADLETLELFATHAAVALENSRLYEEEVRREREAEVLLRVARFTGETLELGEVLSRVAQEVADALDLERCFLGFFERVEFDPEVGREAEIGPLYAFGFSEDLEAFRPFVIAEDAFDRLLEDQEPIVFNDMSGDESLRDQPPAALLAAQACVIAPLVVQGQVLGVLYADTLRSGATILEQEARLAAAIADQASLAIQNARLFSRIEAQEAHYRLLAEAAHDVIITTDLEGRVTYTNPAVRETLGYEPSELLEMEYRDLLDEDTSGLADRAWREMLAGNSSATTYEGQARRKDGGFAYMEVNLNALRHQGRVIGGLAIARDLSAKRQLAEETLQRGREEQRALELRTYLSLFTQAQEEERRRIARELHDDTAQRLVAIGRRLDRLETMIEKSPPEEARARAADIRADLDAAIDSVRRFSRNLRPSVLDDLGLVPALEWLCSQARTSTRLELSGPENRFKPELELTLFRVIQEALSNVDKHAHAQSAAVRVRFDPDGLEHPEGLPGVLVQVSDDGRGFTSSDALEPDHFARLAQDGHLGLAGMRERVSLAGGTMGLTTGGGQGSTLEFWFPG